ncbi:hypothetical protein ACP70R_000862 [Stipagrostis hirtigluma subsp. patula]
MALPDDHPLFDGYRWAVAAMLFYAGAVLLAQAGVVRATPGFLLAVLVVGGLLSQISTSMMYADRGTFFKFPWSGGGNVTLGTEAAGRHTPMDEALNWVPFIIGFMIAIALVNRVLSGRRVPVPPPPPEPVPRRGRRGRRA